MSEAGASREGTARRGGGGELTSFTSARSSASVHSSLLTEGHTWLCHLHARRKVLRKERKCRAREMTMAVGVGAGVWGVVPFSALLARPARELVSDQGPRLRPVIFHLRCHTRGCNVCGVRTARLRHSMALHARAHALHVHMLISTHPSRAASGSHPPLQSTPVGQRFRTGSRLGLRTGLRVELGLGVGLGLGIRAGAETAATVMLKLTRFWTTSR